MESVTDKRPGRSNVCSYRSGCSNLKIKKSKYPEVYFKNYYYYVCVWGMGSMLRECVHAGHVYEVRGNFSESALSFRPYLELNSGLQSRVAKAFISELSP